MNILIIGGTGFIGSNLVPRLLSEGHVLTIVDRQNHSKKNTFIINNNIKYLKCNVEDAISVEHALVGISEIDAMIYLVSATKPAYSQENPIYDINSNLNTIVNLFRIPYIGSIKKIIYLSSGGTVYGPQSSEKISESHQTNPIVSYGIVKLAIEKYLLLFQQKYKNQINILRVSNPYGPGQIAGEGQGLISNVIKKNLENSIIEVFGDGKLIRDYIYIDDLVEAIVRTLEYKGTEKIFNIGTGVGTDINKVIDIIGSEFKINRKNIIYVKERGYDLDKNILDTTLAHRELQWTPTTELSLGIKKTIKWASNNISKINADSKKYILSVIIPCFNEEKHIGHVIQDIIRYRSKNGLKIEIVVVNDGSVDSTKKCVFNEIKENSDIVYLEHDINKGIGASFVTGLKICSGDYIVMIPGDGENNVTNSLYAYPLLSNVDLVIPFFLDNKLRSMTRRFYSSLFIKIINMIFLTKLKYINGTVIYRANIIKSININSSGFFYQAEILIKLIKSGCTYAEVPVHLNRKSSGLPKAMQVQELGKILLNLIKTAFEIYVLKIFK